MTQSSGRRTSDGVTVSNLAETLGTTVRALRHYEDVRLLNPARNSRRMRLYNFDDRARAEMIVALRRADIPLEHIRTAMKGPPPFDAHKIADLLEDRLESVRAQASEIERLLPTLRLEKP